VGLRFVGEVEAGKASVQLEQLLRVIDALGGTLLLRDAAGSPDA
jgi:HTH-type transcriptional regulator / antitoxin HipB